MKSIAKPATIKMFITLLVFNFMQLALLAQDNPASGSSSTTKSVDVSVNTKESWYASPWVWVIGAAVFILLLVALLGGNKSRSVDSSSDRVTVTKTVERDTDI